MMKVGDTGICYMHMHAHTILKIDIFRIRDMLCPRVVCGDQIILFPVVV
jgi:hypothetical protein